MLQIQEVYTDATDGYSSRVIEDSKNRRIYCKHWSSIQKLDSMEAVHA